jgi:hypothetical protein
MGAATLKLFTVSLGPEPGTVYRAILVAFYDREQHTRAGAVRPRPQCSRGYAVNLSFLIQLVKGLKGSLKIRLHSQYLQRNYRSGPRRKDHMYQTH